MNTPQLNLGVVGAPIRHSRSPEIHQVLGKLQGINVEYHRILATPATFEGTVKDFFVAGGHGLNVTLPFKNLAAALAQQLTPKAQLVGAVNTLWLEQGQIHGDSTDGAGFIADVQRFAGQQVWFGDVVILGAGGAVQSILPDILAQQPRRLWIFNRTASKAKILIDVVESWRQLLGFNTVLQAGGFVDFNELMTKQTHQNQVSLLVQGTSGTLFEEPLSNGLGQTDAMNLSKTYCYDLNYSVRAQPFIDWATCAGALQLCDGWGMLVGQAAASFKAWSGKTIQVGDAMTALENTNPWLDEWWIPPFNEINIDQIRAAIETRLSEKEQGVAARFSALINGELPLSWSSFVGYYEELSDKLARVWGVLKHLEGVLSSDASRKAIQELQPLISDQDIKEQQNPQFKHLVAQLLKEHRHELTSSQRRWCEKSLQDFRLAGADLPEAQQAQFASLERELGQLSTDFSNQVLDATEAWSLDVAATVLPGVPLTTVESAQELYKRANPESTKPLCRLTLKGPCYLAVIKFCQNAEIREKIYTAFVTRASDQGPAAGKFDTTPLIKAILFKRGQQAQLLGFEHYAAYSLATKMANSATEVLEFLQNLASLSKQQAFLEKQALEVFAVEKLGLSSLKPWDYNFVSEKLRQAAFDLDSEAIRNYFPTDHVIQGMFQVVEQLFGIQCVENSAVPVYHDDVRCIELFENGVCIAALIVDLYARDKKRGGAWMDECRQRLTRIDKSTKPVAYLVCNSSAPTGSKPSLMTHDEVVTLFHEMGHCLHHVLSKIDVAGIAGIRGVEWDAVEVPSQLMENWCYQPEVIPLLSKHYLTGEPLPHDMLTKIIAARNFQSALGLMKQLEYSMFDMQLHSLFPKSLADVAEVEAVLATIRQEVGVLPLPDWHRFANGFTHIFAGGYAAGYYGYKWAEVYAADLFSEFKQQDVMSQTLGQRLLKQWLSIGGLRSASENFKSFTGRDVNLSALLQDLGIDAVAN